MSHTTYTHNTNYENITTTLNSLYTIYTNIFSNEHKQTYIQNKKIRYGTQKLINLNNTIHYTITSIQIQNINRIKHRNNVKQWKQKKSEKNISEWIKEGIEMLLIDSIIMSNNSNQNLCFNGTKYI